MEKKSGDKRVSDIDVMLFDDRIEHLTKPTGLMLKVMGLYDEQAEKHGREPAVIKYLALKLAGAKFEESVEEGPKKKNRTASRC